MSKTPDNSKELTMLDIEIGDLTIVDTGDLGVVIFIGDTKVAYFNSMGANSLAEWLTRRMRIRINNKYKG